MQKHSETHAQHISRLELHSKLIKAIPYTSLSQPFVEQLIVTIRREYLDHVLFWNAADPERKPEDFRQFYNPHRVHSSISSKTPAEISGKAISRCADLGHFQWKSRCRDLYRLPADV